jgi:NifB/MoaA-like Fe-S oxidoreductase
VKLLAQKLAERGRVEAEVRVVPNRMLGGRVTTAGLLAGRDIVRALRGQRPSDIVLVPASAVREGEGFLDGMTLSELCRRLGAPVAAAGSPREAAAALRAFDRGRSER